MIRAIVERARRLRPGRIPAVHLPWIVACWLLTAVAAVVVLVPGLTEAITAEPAGSSTLVGRFHAPLVLRLLVVAAGGVLAGALVVRILLRERLADAVPRPVAREFAIAVGGGFPALALAADGEWLLAGAALVPLVLAEFVVRRPRTGSSAGVLLVGGLVAAAWGVLLLAQGITATAEGGRTWIALFAAAAAFAAFGSYYGVARAAESRVAWVRPLFRDDLRLPVLVAALAASLLVVGLRLTVARELFPDPDPALWTPLAEAPVSWLHAAAVAGCVVLAGLLSVRRPFRRSRERRITAALAVAGNAELAAGLVVVVVIGLAVAVVSGREFFPAVSPVAVAALKVAGVVAVTLVALAPAFAGTAARALALVSGVYLVPLTVQGLLAASGMTLPGPLVGFAASPVQVALLLLAVAVVAVVVPPARRAFGTGLIVRLAVVPLVAVHAGWLLPAAWSEAGRVVLVVAVILAILVLLPPPDPDRSRHALVVLGASAAQLLTLVVFLLALPSFFDDPSLVVLGLFWLSIAVIVASTVRTVDDPEAVDAATEGAVAAR